MPKTLTLAVFLGLAATVFAAAPADSPHLTLLFTNSIRGETEPCGCKVNPRGGLAQKAAYVSSVLAEPGSQVLLIDAGDAFFKPLGMSPSIPWSEREDPYTKQLRGQAEAIVAVGNRLGQAAQGIGRHDFGMGIEFLAGLAKKANFPFVISNARPKPPKEGQTPVPWPFKKDLVLERYGMRIGVLSLVNPKEEFTDKDRLEVEPAEPTLKRLLEPLRRKTDLVILLSNLSTVDNLELAEKVKGIDILIGCDNGNLVDPPKRINDTLVMEAHQRGKMVGRLDLTLVDGHPDWDAGFERVNVASQLRRIEQALASHRAKGDPQEVYKDNPSVMTIYNSHLQQEARLKEKLKEMDKGTPPLMDYQLVPMEKDGPKDEAIEKLVEEMVPKVQQPPKGMPPPGAHP